MKQSLLCNGQASSDRFMNSLVSSLLQILQLLGRVPSVMVDFMRRGGHADEETIPTVEIGANDGGTAKPIDIMQRLKRVQKVGLIIFPKSKLCIYGGQF